MIISVLERRAEIGLRRALGATQGQIRTQFLAESILLAVIGGVGGVLAGATATAAYAHSKNWAIVIPVEAWSGGIAAAILIGASPAGASHTSVSDAADCCVADRMRTPQRQRKMTRLVEVSLDPAGSTRRVAIGRLLRMGVAAEGDRTLCTPT